MAKNQKTAADLLEELRQRKGLGPVEEEEELKPAEELKKLTVSVKTDQSYRLGDTVRVEVSIKDTLGENLSAVPVDVTIYDSGDSIQASGQGITNANGIAYFGSELMPEDPLGTYTAEAVVTAPGYKPGKGYTTFEVVKPDAAAAPVTVENGAEEQTPEPVAAAPVDDIDTVVAEAFAEPAAEEEEPEESEMPVTVENGAEEQSPETVDERAIDQAGRTLIKAAEKLSEIVAAEIVAAEVKKILEADPEKFRGPAGKYGAPGQKGDPGLKGDPGERGEMGEQGLAGRSGLDGEPGKISIIWIGGAIIIALLGILISVFSAVFRPSVDMDVVKSEAGRAVSAYLESETGKAEITRGATAAAEAAIAKKLAEIPRRPATTPTTTTEGTETTTTPEPKVQPPAAKETEDFDALMEMIK